MTRGLYVVMGVCGAGKTLIGEALAQALGVHFIEGDTFHPAESVARMAAGVPLTDADRAAWLVALAARIAMNDPGSGMVMSCSALKRSYRDVLRSGDGDVQFIFLRGSRELIAERVAGRRGHYMPPSLVESQFVTLEEPAPDEGAWVCDASDAPEEIVAALVARIAARRA